MSLETESPIVKCSHCKQILSLEQFNSHECEMPITTVKEIPVAYFRDDSNGNRNIIVGRGLDGVLYTFEVVPRKPIPLILPLDRRQGNTLQTRRQGNRMRFS